MEPDGFEAAKHDKLGTYGGRVAYLIIIGIANKIFKELLLLYTYFISLSTVFLK
jgi:hypothetical protein